MEEFLSVQKLLKQLYKEGNPVVGFLGEESGTFDYYILYKSEKIISKHKSWPKRITRNEDRANRVG